MNGYLPILVLFALSAALFAQNLTVSLDLPGEGYTFGASERVELIYSFMPDDPSQSSLPCTIYIDNANPTTQLTSKETSTIFRPSAMDSGAHTWKVFCADAVFGEPSGWSPAQSFSVRPSSFITLGSPQQGYEYQPSEQVRLIYSYIPTVQSQYACMLFIDGSEVQSQPVAPPQQSIEYVAQGLSGGTHSWRVRCTDSYGVSDYSFEGQFSIIVPQVHVYLSTPDDGHTFAHQEAISLYYSYTAAGVQIPLYCSVYIDGQQALEPQLTFDSESVQFVAEGVAPGTHEWQVKCSTVNNDISEWSETRQFVLESAPQIVPTGGSSGGSSGTSGSSGPTSGGGAVNRSAQETAKEIPAVQETTAPVAQPPPAPLQPELAAVFAPDEVYVNSSLQIAVTSAMTGRPIAGAIVVVYNPDGTMMKLTADSSGRASYVADKPGVYSYRVTGYSLSGTPTTRAIANPYASDGSGGLIDSAVANGIYFAGALLVVVLFAGAYFFITKKPEEGS